jgi:hypothetical protein
MKGACLRSFSSPPSTKPSRPEPRLHLHPWLIPSRKTNRQGQPGPARGPRPSTPCTPERTACVCRPLPRTVFRAPAMAPLALRLSHQSHQRRIRAPETVGPDVDPLGDGGGAAGPLQPGIVADDETEGTGCGLPAPAEFRADEVHGPAPPDVSVQVLPVALSQHGVESPPWWRPGRCSEPYEK